MVAATVDVFMAVERRYGLFWNSQVGACCGRCKHHLRTGGIAKRLELPRRPRPVEASRCQYIMTRAALRVEEVERKDV